jgi:hypothetical protein
LSRSEADGKSDDDVKSGDDAGNVVGAKDELLDETGCSSWEPAKFEGASVRHISLREYTRMLWEGVKWFVTHLYAWTSVWSCMFI